MWRRDIWQTRPDKGGEQSEQRNPPEQRNARCNVEFWVSGLTGSFSCRKMIHLVIFIQSLAGVLPTFASGLELGNLLSPALDVILFLGKVQPQHRCVTIWTLLLCLCVSNVMQHLRTMP